MGKLTDKVAKGVFWVLLEKCGVQGVHFVVTLVLARLLTPNDYGTVALLSIFISISNTFVDCGFGKALVQKKNATQTDMNSVFFLSVAIALGLYAVLFLGAPLVADFYRILELTPMMRILSLSLIFNSVNGVQNVELNRKMLFKLSFRISWVSAVVKGVTGVTMAYLGYGAWALVWASLAGGASGVIARQFVIAWRPTLTFSWGSLRGLFRFGWKMTVSSLAARIFQDIVGFLIGKIYTRADLAFYNKGGHVPNLLVKLVDATLGRVSFSALVRLQDKEERLRNALRRMIRCSSFLVCPLMFVLAVLAKPLVLLMYGKNWEPCAMLMVFFCIMRLPRALSTMNAQGFLARGRSDIYLRVVVIRRITGVLTLLCAFHFGLTEYVATVAALSIPLTFLVDTWPNRKLLGYSFRMQMADFMPALLLAAVTGGCVYALTVLFPLCVYALVPAGIAAYFGLYLGIAYLLRMPALAEFSAALEPRLLRRAPFAVGLARSIRRRCGK